MKKERILVVDDEKHICQSLAILLKGQGFEVTTAGCGREAIDILSSHKPDIVILDMVLPDVNGIDIIKHFEEKNVDFKTIVITGNATIESAVEALKKGAYDYLKKPFEFEELLKRVENALEQKRLSAESIAMKKNLQLSEEKFQRLVQHTATMKAVATLAGGMAHDFNNILMNVLGYTSLLIATSVPGSPEHEKLLSIEKQVRSGTKITKQLLNLAKGRKRDTVVLDIRDLIKSISDIYQKTGKNISIEHVFDKNMHCIEADEGQVEQVMMNLYVNACHAMPHGGKIIVETGNIKIKPQNPQTTLISPGRYVMIKVKDTGTGMDEEILQRVFEPFFTTKGNELGSGLGLSSCYEIIKNHGGIITATSQKQIGSEFTIYLPASDKKPQKIEPPREKVFKGSETVMLVDDEPSMLNVAAEMLQTLGYKTITANSPHHAVDVFKKNREHIDVVVLDYLMPEMNGGELFNVLRQENSNTRFILATGLGDELEVEDIVKNGFCSFIQKPFGINDISRKIREALESGKC